MRTIDTFSGRHRYLSNFSPAPVKLDGVTYPTVEHAYQAAKTLGDQTHFQTGSPGDAKRRGRVVGLRPDWESVKVAVMLDLLRQKFADRDRMSALLGTGDAELIEGNTWGDRFWGVCRGSGENHLGKLLMQVRAEYAKEGE